MGNWSPVSQPRTQPGEQPKTTEDPVVKKALEVLGTKA
jgi:hypothetical protein